MAAVAVAPVESAIAGKRLTLIEQAKGCHESMAPFFFMHSVHAVSAATTGDGAGSERNEPPATRREVIPWYCVWFAGTLTHHDGEYGQGH